MKIVIEKVDGHYIVRCSEPANPPFKDASVSESLDNALESAKSMILFLERGYASRERP